MDQNILINVWLIVKRSKLDNGNAVCFCVGEHNVVRGYIMKTIMVVMMISDDIRLLPLFVAGLIELTWTKIRTCVELKPKFDKFK